MPSDLEASNFDIASELGTNQIDIHNVADMHDEPDDRHDGPRNLSICMGLSKNRTCSRGLFFLVTRHYLLFPCCVICQMYSGGISTSRHPAGVHVYMERTPFSPRDEINSTSITCNVYQKLNTNCIASATIPTRTQRDSCRATCKPQEDRKRLSAHQFPILKQPTKITGPRVHQDLIRRDDLKWTRQD